MRNLHFFPCCTVVSADGEIVSYLIETSIHFSLQHISFFFFFKIAVHEYTVGKFLYFREKICWLKLLC